MICLTLLAGVTRANSPAMRFALAVIIAEGEASEAHPCPW